MFLFAAARKLWDMRNNRYFDGEIDIWQFVTCDMAWDSRRNSLRVTMATKHIISMAEDV